MDNKPIPFNKELATNNLHLRLKPSEMQYYKYQANKARMNVTQWAKHKLGYWPNED